MPVLVSVQAVKASYGARVLFRDVSLALNDGDRMGLVGPNGAGKSTLLKILAGIDAPDAGTRAVRNLARVAYVPQVSLFPDGQTTAGAVTAALAGLGLDETSLAVRRATALARVGLDDEEKPVTELSGGWRKRLSIACALAVEPDAILLDEPTNHLDIDAVLWLERLIKSSPFAVIVVTHDRVFLENVANRMVDLSPSYPQGYFTVAGNYSEFLLRQEEYFIAQAKEEESLSNRVRREVEWLRRGPKARATKAKYRVEEAKQLVAELADLKERRAAGTAALEFDGSGRKTRQLLVAQGVTKSLGGRQLFQDVDVLLAPGTRLGVLGGNGSGKTTLLRTLTGDIAPDSGTVTTADSLQVVYFDQNREQLDLDASLREALAPAGGDSVVYRGSIMHVAAWAKRFLFRPEQLDVAVGTLSGGEQNRVLVARLMLTPADVLVLDEPTNDLDIRTLEVLEETLVDFPGALVLVTHDRYLLDRVSTSLLALDGGEATYHADFDQWEAHRKARRDRPVAAPAEAAPRPARKSLSYKDKQELQNMEATITAAEEELAQLRGQLEDPDVASDAERLHDTWSRVQAAQERVDGLYRRWEELESQAG
jgi:ATP-binding cassette subfamily F protein uup